MSLPSDVVVLMVTRGRAEMPRMVFRRGQPVEPLGVGADGEWQIDGDSVPDIAFYLAFDGEQAHASSAAPEAAVYVDGRRLDATWIPLMPACEIRFGSAIVRSGAKPAVVVGRMRASMPSLPAPLAPLAHLASLAASLPAATSAPVFRDYARSSEADDVDDEKTQVHRPHTLGVAPAIAKLPPTRAPAESEPTLFDNTLRKEALAYAGAPTAPPAQAKAPATSKATSASVSTPTPTGPAMLHVSAVAKAPSDVTARATTAVISKPRRLSTLGRTAIVLAVVLLGANVARFSRTSPHVTMAPVDAAMAANTPTPPAAPIAPATPPAPPPMALPPAAVAAPVPKGTASVTPERRAVSAAASGRFAEAARLYDELSKQNPRVASYAVAAKVLRTRATQGDDE